MSAGSKNICEFKNAYRFQKMLTNFKDIHEYKKCSQIQKQTNFEKLSNYSNHEQILKIRNYF